MLLAVYLLGLKHRPKKVGPGENPKQKDKSSGGENTTELEESDEEEPQGLRTESQTPHRGT